MCSVGDDVFDESGAQSVMVQMKDRTASSSKCNKCRSDVPKVILRGKDPYCKKCFLLNATHKFKAELGKSKLIRPRDRVLVHHGIGHPSAALLHLLRSGLDLDTPKKLRFTPVFTSIDDQYQLNFEERRKVMEQMQRQVGESGFELQVISLKEYVSNPGEINMNFKVTSDEELWNNVPETNRKELRTIYTRRLLVDAAKLFGCKFVFTPEISTDIAATLLANVSLGRYQITNDTGFCDNRNEGVTILRPLRHFDIKEVVFYNRFNGLQPTAVRETQTDPFSSIHSLTRRFVEDLQENFPATVSTVLRTGDKLVVDMRNVRTCSLCKVSFHIEDNVLTAREAIDVSNIISIGEEVQDKKDCISFHCYSCLKLVHLI